MARYTWSHIALFAVFVIQCRTQTWSTGSNPQFQQNNQIGQPGAYNNDRYGAGGALGGGQGLSPFQPVYEWYKVEYNWMDEMTKMQSIGNRRYIPENNAIAGIKVYRDRIFLTVPRWKEGIPVTIASVPSQPVQPNAPPLLEPFPNWQMQEIGNCTAFQFVQSMEIDTEGRMWILDSGRTNILDTNTQNSRCPPKLVIIDLNSVQYPPPAFGQPGQFPGQPGQPGYQGSTYPNQPYNPNNQQYPNSQYPNTLNSQYPNNPNSQYPNNPNSQYPNNPNSQYPNNPSSQYPNNPNSQYPNNPNPQYPNNPNSQYPNSQYPNNPNSQYPNSQYPNNPNSQYPNNPNSQYPNSQYPNNPNSQSPNIPGQYPNSQYPNNQNSQYGRNTQYPQQNYNQGGQYNQFNNTPQYDQFGNPVRGGLNQPFGGFGVFGSNFRIIKSFNFPSNVAAQYDAYLNDIVLDNANGWYAYITDHGNDPGIIVYSFREDRAWKVKDARSMRADPDIGFLKINNIDVELRGKNIDGIALSPGSSYDRTLYFSPLGSYNLYSLPTSVLKNANLPSDVSSSVTDLGRKESISDGMIMDNRGNLYYGLLNQNAIAVWNTNRGRFTDSQRVLARDNRALQWPDSFAFDDAGNLYVTTNRLQNYLTGRVTTNEPNYRVLRAQIGARSYLAPADTSGGGASAFDQYGRSSGSGYNAYETSNGYYNGYWGSATVSKLSSGLVLILTVLTFLLYR